MTIWAPTDHPGTNKTGEAVVALRFAGMPITYFLHRKWYRPEMICMAVGHDRWGAVWYSEEVGRDLEGPQSLQTAGIDKCDRTARHQHRVATSLGAHATDGHALHVPGCLTLLSRMPALP